MDLENEVTENEEIPEEAEADEEESLDNTEGEKNEEPSDEIKEEVSITVEGATERNEPAPKWVSDLRKNHRELLKEKKELEQKLKSLTQADEGLGKKPTLEDCDYDTEKFESKLESWHEKKRKADERQAEEAKRNQQAIDAWNARLAAYEDEKQGLGVPDFDEAEGYIEDTLSEVQRGIIIQGSDSPAKVKYALFKYPDKAKELAEIKDPVRFAVKVGEFMRDIKMERKQVSTKPEKRVSGNAPISGAVDSTLDRLRAEAEKSGDYTKVLAYKRSKRK